MARMLIVGCLGVLLCGSASAQMLAAIIAAQAVADSADDDADVAWEVCAPRTQAGRPGTPPRPAEVTELCRRYGEALRRKAELDSHLAPYHPAQRAVQAEIDDLRAQIVAWRESQGTLLDIR